MNSLELVSATVKLQKTRRVPVIPQVFGHAAVLSGVSVEDYTSNGEMLAQCQLNALKHYGHDAVFSVMDANVEAEAAGCVLEFHKERYSEITKYALSPGGQFLSPLVVPHPEKAGRMPEMLKALTILRKELGMNTMIFGCVLGPFSVATQLLGLEAALYMAVDDPARLEALTDFATDTIIRFGLAQLKAGAHAMLVFDPSSSPAVIPPNFFREFIFPRLKKTCNSFDQAGSMANWLHIAGPAAPILPFYPAAGVHIANFDYYISAAQAIKGLPATCVNGNIKPLAFVEDCPDAIRKESMDLMTAFLGRRGFILSSGCEVPLESRPENIMAMVGAAREFSNA